MASARANAALPDGWAVLLVLLLAAHAFVFIGVRGFADDREFDPLQPLGRQVETAIETGRFADALPVALDLRAAHPSDPTILYWLGEIYRGLGRAASEVAAWQEYTSASATPVEACPALPLALTKAGDASRALQAYEACVGYAPDDAERLLDLAAEYSRRGQPQLARATWQRALAVDPGDPRIGWRMAALAEGESK